NADETKCKARGCLWEPSNLERVPWCFYPQDYGYTFTTFSQTDSGITLDISRNAKHKSTNRPGSPDINNLRVQVFYLSSDMLRFKIWDPATERYEVPVPLNVPANPETDENKRMYKVELTNNPFGIRVIRKSTGTAIWDSSVPGFTFSDLFIQVSTKLSSEFVYGFGETEHPTYKHNFNYHTWGMFAKDQPPGVNVTFQPTPAITYRTLGGILDFFMVLGPTPEMVVEEYTALIGRPVLPAYWSLGFQLCRYGYANDTEIKNLYEDMKAAGIPYDVQYGDIDYMERQLDFVLDEVNFKGLPALVDSMRAEGMRFIFILLYRAYAAFPDFFRTSTALWWQKEISDFYNVVKFDGIWIVSKIILKYDRTKYYSNPM
uniref:P-type domain-containing protein n=1 Tax=Periophthalmus magnuspinnatus TaxID=409849 RepID=A0A3B4B102_9GOBI